MRKRRWRAGATWGAALAGFLCFVPFAPPCAAEPSGGAEAPAVTNGGPSAGLTLPNFVDLARKSFPAVVNISTTTNGDTDVH